MLSAPIKSFGFGGLQRMPSSRTDRSESRLQRRPSGPAGLTVTKADGTSSAAVARSLSMHSSSASANPDGALLMAGGTNITKVGCCYIINAAAQRTGVETAQGARTN